MSSAVRLENVTKLYGAVEAVRDVAFALKPGATALVGHNGAGKTTLMKLMLGLVRPTHGSVRVLGENPASGDFSARRRVGYLPEIAAFNGALTGREVIAFYARLKGAAVADGERLLEEVGLGPAARRRIGGYSKGMRQRLGLAQALIGAPRVLLLDEPTTGLDPELRRNFYEIVDRLVAGGATVLLSTHALNELEARTERILIMDRGKLVADGPLETLRAKAALPTRLRVRVDADGFEPPAIGAWRALGPRAFEADIADDRRVEALRALLCGTNAVADVEIAAPTLEELYAHFVDARSAAP